MAVTILKLPVSPSPIGSFFGGVNQGENLAQQQARNQILKTQNQYLPQQLQAASNLAKAKLLLAQNQVQFSPLLNTAKLNNLNAMTSYNQERAQYTPLMDQANINRTNSDIGINNLRGQNIQQQMGLNQQLNTAKINNLNTSSNVNQQRINALKQQQQIAPLRLNNQQKQTAIRMMGIMPDALRSALIADNTPTFLNNLSPLGPITSSTAQDVSNAAKLNTNQRLTTNATRVQQEGGTQVMAMINDPHFMAGEKAAEEYAGMFGKGKEMFNAWTKSNNGTYTAAQDFIKTQKPLLINRIRSLDKVGVTDSQREELENMVNYAFDNFSSNPKQAMASLEEFRKSMGEIDRAVQKSGFKIYDTSNIGPSAAPPAGRISVIAPDGSTGHIPKSQVATALKNGYRVK
jgi:hypothetical protein